MSRHRADYRYRRARRVPGVSFSSPSLESLPLGPPRTLLEEQGTPNPFKIRDKVSTHGNGKAPNSLKIRDRVVSRSLKIKDTQSHRGAAV